MARRHRNHWIGIDRLVDALALLRDRTGDRRPLRIQFSHGIDHRSPTVTEIRFDEDHTFSSGCARCSDSRDLLSILQNQMTICFNNTAIQHDFSHFWRWLWCLGSAGRSPVAADVEHWNLDDGRRVRIPGVLVLRRVPRCILNSHQHRNLAARAMTPVAESRPRFFVSFVVFCKLCDRSMSPPLIRPAPCAPKSPEIGNWNLFGAWTLGTWNFPFVSFVHASELWVLPALSDAFVTAVPESFSRMQAISFSRPSAGCT